MEILGTSFSVILVSCTCWCSSWCSSVGAFECLTIRESWIERLCPRNRTVSMASNSHHPFVILFNSPTHYVPPHRNQKSRTRKSHNTTRTDSTHTTQHQESYTYSNTKEINVTIQEESRQVQESTRNPYILWLGVSSCNEVFSRKTSFELRHYDIHCDFQHQIRRGIERYSTPTNCGCQKMKRTRTTNSREKIRSRKARTLCEDRKNQRTNRIS